MIKRLCFLFFAVILPFSAMAEGRANHFKVKYVRVDHNGKGYVRFYDLLANTPAACGSSHPYHLAFDTNTAGGKSIYSLVLAAHATGKVVQAYGTNSCHVYSSVESWNWGFIVNE